MKRRTFTLYGNACDGKLLIKNKSEMKRFLNEWGNADFTLELTLLEPNTSTNLIAYYKKSIVPDFQHAFKDRDGEVMTLSQTDIKLREMTVSMKHSESIIGHDGFIECLLPIETAGDHRATEYIKELKIIASVEFDFVIRPPKIYN